MKFKVKRRWVMWIVGILYNILAIRFLYIKWFNILFIISFIIEIIIILTQVHLSYTIENKCIVIRRILYPNKTIPCEMITIVENESLVVAGVCGLITLENSGIYKITYYDKSHNMHTVVVSIKDSSQFMTELTLYVDRKVIEINK